MMLRVTPRDAIEQEPDRGAAHLPNRLGNRGQRRIDGRRLRDIIEPDHRDIPRYAVARSLQRSDGADGHLVVEGEDGGHVASRNDPPLQKLTDRTGAPIRPAIAPDDTLGGDGKPGVPQRALKTGDPPGTGRQVIRPHQARDATVAETDQMLCGQIAAPLIVNQYLV